MLPTRTALIIDDNKMDLIVLQRLVQKAFGEAETASNYSQAKEYLEENIYDLIILDLHLPDAYGMEVIDEISALQPNTPIFVVSGLNHLKDFVELLKAKKAKCFVKSYSSEGLKELESELLQL